MDAFLAYLGYSAIGIAVFYLFFKLLLSKDKSFRFNRALILASAFLSMILPCIHLEMNFLPENPSGGMALDFLQTKPISTTASGIAGNPSSTTISSLILSGIYFLGLVLCLLHIGILPCLRLHRLVSKGKTLETQGSIKILSIPEAIPAMSWFHYILLPDISGKEFNPYMLQHEKAHIRSGHSYDLVFMDLICLLQWFNPFAWLFLKELKTVHEYEADAMVLHSGADAKGYQYLLIEETMGRDRYHLAHLFNTNLKKRLTMIQKKKFSKWVYAKALYMIPLVTASLVVFARQPENPASLVSTGKPESSFAKALPQEGDLAKPVKQANPDELASPTKEQDTYAIPDKRPQAPEGFLDWVSQETKYPEALQKTGAEATVYVGFTVRKDGSLGDIEPMELRISGKKVEADYSLFEKEAVRIISKSPAWTPGETDGKKVDVRYVLPLVFRERK